MAGFLALARQRVFPKAHFSDVVALHAEGNYSSGHCSGLAPDSLSTLPSFSPLKGCQKVAGITKCAAKLRRNGKYTKRKCFFLLLFGKAVKLNRKQSPKPFNWESKGPPFYTARCVGRHCTLCRAMLHVVSAYTARCVKLPSRKLRV